MSLMAIVRLASASLLLPHMTPGLMSHDQDPFCMRDPAHVVLRNSFQMFGAMSSDIGG